MSKDLESVILIPVPEAIELTKKLTNLFPENPPYCGKFPEINPLLTIGQLKRGDNFKKILSVVSGDVNPQLPQEARATEVRLMVENPNKNWTVLSKFPLLNI